MLETVRPLEAGKWYASVDMQLTQTHTVYTNGS